MENPLEPEIWKASRLAEHLEVSSYGKVRHTLSKRELKPYIEVRIHIKRNRHQLSKLVANEFVENPDNKTVIDHIDRNRLNNNASNLRYLTSQENCWNKAKWARWSTKHDMQWKGVGLQYTSTVNPDKLVWNANERFGMNWCHRDADFLGLIYNLDAIYKYGLIGHLNDVPVEVANASIVWD